MADTLPVHIKVDAGDAAQVSKRVEEGLAKVEDKAQALTKSMKGVADAFSKLGEAMRREQSALERTRAIHEELRAKSSPLAQGFAKIAAALEHERQVLQSIRGPAQEAMRDIQSLTMLLAKGAITAGEFNAKLASIRPPSNFRPGASSRNSFDMTSLASALPGGSIISGAIGGGVAGAAQAGLSAAIGGAGHVIAMADAYTSLNNRLKALTGSQEAAAELFDKLHTSANKTYSDLNTTTQSFITFSRALKGLGASQNDVIAFTEHINEVIAMSGTDATGASAAMLQLSQALSSGVLRGEEFNSVIEQAPALLDPIAKHLGVTVGQLRGLAQQGKITSKIIYDSFNEAGTSIEQAFGQSVPTISQQFQVLKNDIGKTVGEMAKSAELGKVVASVMSNLKLAIAATVEQTKLLSHSFGVLGETVDVSLGDLASGSGTGLKAVADYISGKGGNDIDKWNEALGLTHDRQQVLNRVIAEGSGKLNEYSQAMVQQTLQTQLGAGAANAFKEAVDRATGKTDAWRDSTSGISTQIAGLTKNLSDAIAAVASWDGALDALLRKIDPWYDAHERQVSVLGDVTTSLLHSGVSWDALTKKIEKNAAAAKKANDEYAKLGRALLGSESPSARAIRQGAAERAGQQSELELIAKLEQGTATGQLELFNAQLAQLDDLQARAAISAEAYTTALNGLTGGGAGAFQKSIDEQAAEIFRKQKEAIEGYENDLVKDANEKSARFKEAWAQGLGDVGGSFIRAALDGQQSFHEMVENMLKDLALLTLRMGALSLVQQGGTAGTVGTVLSGLLGGANGFDYVANNKGLQLPGFGNGGDALALGSGGTDSKIAMFRITPGESVHVRTPQQREEAMEAAAPRGNTTVLVQLENDRRDLVEGFDSREGERVFARIDRRMGRSKRR